MPKRLTDLSAVKLELADKKIELVDVKDLRFDPKIRACLQTLMERMNVRSLHGCSPKETFLSSWRVSVPQDIFRENPYSWCPETEGPV